VRGDSPSVRHCQGYSLDRLRSKALVGLDVPIVLSEPDGRCGAFRAPFFGPLSFVLSTKKNPPALLCVLQYLFRSSLMDSFRKLGGSGAINNQLIHVWCHCDGFFKPYGWMLAKTIKNGTDQAFCLALLGTTGCSQAHPAKR